MNAEMSHAHKRINNIKLIWAVGNIFGELKPIYSIVIQEGICALTSLSCASM